MRSSLVRLSGEIPRGMCYTIPRNNRHGLRCMLYYLSLYFGIFLTRKYDRSFIMPNYPAMSREVERTCIIISNHTALTNTIYQRNGLLKEAKF